MIHTIIIFTCTVINSFWGFYWIGQLNKQYKDSKRKRHLELCSRCIECGSCPHNCEVCAWGDVMTERQLNQEKKVRKFLEKDHRIIPDAIKLDKNVIIKKDEEGKQQYIDTYIDFHTKMFEKVRDNY